MSDRTCTMPDCAKPHRARGLCSTHYNQGNAKPVTMTCTVCGATVTKDRHYTNRKPVCSYACRSALQGGSPRPKLASKPREPKLCRNRRCSQPVPIKTTRGGGTSRLYCSRLCQLTRYGKALTRPVHYIDCRACRRIIVSPVPCLYCPPCKRRRGQGKWTRHRSAIFERDRYRCHICHRTVRTDAPVPHPRAATLDHLVPRSHGGTDDPANLATACFSCNVSRSNRGGNEQLMIFG